MNNPTFRLIASITITSAIIVVSNGEAKEGAAPRAPSFLQHAAQGQQSEIDLGQLAIQRGADDQVKQFGARMVQDHQKTQQEIQRLAAQEGVSLQAEPSEPQKQIKSRLAKLSGKEFDRAYITAMMKDHRTHIKEFTQHSLADKDQNVRHWAASAVPVLKEHMEKLKTIASSLGVAQAPKL